LSPTFALTSRSENRSSFWTILMSAPHAGTTTTARTSAAASQYLIVTLLSSRCARRGGRHQGAAARSLDRPGVLGDRLHARQVDLECRSASRLAHHGDVAATLLDHAVHGGESEPRALAGPLGREERLEDAVARRRV